MLDIKGLNYFLSLDSFAHIVSHLRNPLLGLTLENSYFFSGLLKNYYKQRNEGQ